MCGTTEVCALTFSTVNVIYSNQVISNENENLASESISAISIKYTSYFRLNMKGS